MGKYTGASCRLCRREGMKLFLKGFRCETVKCAIAKRAYPPGMRSWKRRSKVSDYGTQLREKQRAKRYYGIGERQFKNYFRIAERSKGHTGEKLLQLMERRLDNVVYLLGFALSRGHARQLIGHGHFQVNGRKTDIPSYLARKNDAITPRDRENTKKVIQEALEQNRERTLPSWLARSDKELLGTVVELPTRQDVALPIEEQLIVELCSK